MVNINTLGFDTSVHLSVCNNLNFYLYMYSYMILKQQLSLNIYNFFIVTFSNSCVCYVNNKCCLIEQMY